MRIYLLFIFMSLMYATSGTAATFDTISTTPIAWNERYSGKCTHVLSGEIEIGDEEMVAAAIEALPGQDHDILNFIACLDSTGGNLRTGIEIGKILKVNFFGTYVPENAQCLSACAVAFMHGTVGAYEYFLNHRAMHPSATIGFHAPSIGISVSDGVLVPIEMVNDAYASSRQSIAEIVSAASAPVSDFASPVIPLSLLSEMLSVHDDEFVYVETLHQAFLWDIEIHPHNLKPPAGFDLEVGLYQLCENAAYAIDPNSMVAGPPRIITQQVLDVDKMNVPYEVDMPPDHRLLALHNIFNRECSYKYESERDIFMLRRYVDGRLEQEVWLEPVYLFNPETSISALVGG